MRQTFCKVWVRQTFCKVWCKDLLRVEIHDTILSVTPGNGCFIWEWSGRDVGEEKTVNIVKKIDQPKPGELGYMWTHSLWPLVAFWSQVLESASVLAEFPFLSVGSCWIVPVACRGPFKCWPLPSSILNAIPVCCQWQPSWEHFPTP